MDIDHGHPQLQSKAEREYRMRFHRVACMILLDWIATPLLSSEPYLAVRDRSIGLAQRAVPLSVPGKSLGSISADALTSVEQEAAIYEFLARYDDSSWYGRTIEQLAAILNESVPTFLNRTELDLLGVDPTTRLGLVPFPAASISARLALVLDPLELTYTVRRGVLEITSWDSAEANPVIRVYDVAPLVHGPSGIAGNNSLSEQFRLDELIGTIEMHVDPDSWLSAGGTNSISPIHSTRTFLVVSAPAPTQLAVQALVSTINASLPADTPATRQLLRRPSNELFEYDPAPETGMNEAPPLPRPYLKLRRSP